MPSLEVLLGVVAAVVLLGVIAVRASVRLGLPSLLLYLAIGMLLGESVIGVQFSDAPLTGSMGLAALVLILAEGGLTTRWQAVRPSLGVGVALSTVAVVVSIAVVGTALHLVLDLEWRTAFLWGAVLSSTDAAAVFSVLRGAGVSRRLAGALELEAGANDAPVVLAVILLASGDPITWLTPLLVAYELAAGGAIGALLGLGGAWALRRAALPATGLYPLATIAVCVLAYSTGQLAHASGLLATYVAALVLGNSDLPHRGGVHSFAEGTGWLAQIGLFVMLGLFASPPRLMDAVVPALIAGVVLIVAARPLSVVAAAAPFRVPWREQAFLSWAGLRGAVPIVMATIAFVEGAPSAQALVDVVFVLVVVLTLLQGTTLPWVARRLGVASGVEPRRLAVDAAPLDELSADLLQVCVPVGSKLRGVYLRELRLPRGATVSLVVRGEEAFTPTSETRLRELDQLLVVTTLDARPAAEERIRAVDERGRLAGWRAELEQAEPRAGASSPWRWPMRRAREDGGVSAPSIATAPRVRLLSLIAVLVLAADIVTKVIAVAQLEGREPVELLGGLVYLQLVRNPGAAFSLATGYTWLLTIVAIAVVVVIVRVARRLWSTGWAVALGLVLGGALGNLTDRMFRAPGPLQGHVVDMVSLFAPDGRAWPVFNVADSSIVGGGVLLVLLALLGRELDGTRTADRKNAKDAKDEEAA